jgi:glutamate/tyrosine decarboxylase-like PLP-dependent enzyme
MDTEFERYASGTGAVESATLTDCGTGDPVRIVYSRPESELGGQILCHVDAADGVAYLIWTDDAALGLGIVSNSAGDSEALYQWWAENDFQAER